MKINISLKISSIILMVLFFSCETEYDDRLDTDLTEDLVFNTYDRVINVGYNVYNYIPDGFNYVDDAFIEGATDEAEHSSENSDIQLFNNGGWSQFNNPDNNWNKMYQGIRAANIFLVNSDNFTDFIVPDTSTVVGKNDYLRQIENLGYLRAEARFLRAYFHFELIKRYGGVPIVDQLLDFENSKNVSRSSYEECVNFIVQECDAVTDSLLVSFSTFDNSKEGRITKGTALAFKSRVLLYAASPLNNLGDDNQKWVLAAQAANEVVNMGVYSLHNNYQSLFLAPNSHRSSEVIWSKRYGNTNFLEKANYPAGTEGGNSGTCPSHNLVDSYEKLIGWDASQPYENRDPRLKATVVVNNSTWNGRTIETWDGGRDARSSGLTEATKTGYYLKKFVVDNVDLSQNQTRIHSWIFFRYAEILLNYAEAVNEGYTFGIIPSGFTMSAVEALNLVRSRVSLPPIIAVNKEDLRDKIRQERRIELAFEGHRPWDVRRWKIAESTLGAPLMGTQIEKVDDNTFIYNQVEVESRVFENKMYLYPIPNSEILKYDGNMQQNPGW